MSVVLFTLQIIIDTSFENIISNISSEAAFIFTCLSVFNYQNNRTITTNFLSATIFLIVSSNSLAPMIGTLLEGHSLVYSLFVPVETYFNRFIYAICLLIAYGLSTSKNSFALSNFFVQINRSLKVSAYLPSRIVWYLGLVGLFVFLLKFAGLPEAVEKFFEGFGFLLYFPFILIVPPYSLLKKNQLERNLLIGYFLIMVLISFISNSRMALIAPIGTICGAWLISFFAGLSVVTEKLLIRALTFAVLGVFLIGVFSDLSTAILITRGSRSTNTVEEQISGTIEKFNDKEALENYRLQQISISQIDFSVNLDWKENYLRNPILARFVQIKFDDNLFYRISKLSPENIEELRQKTIDKILAVFPTPIMNILQITVDKKVVNTYSTADLIDTLSGNNSLGFFLTGSLPAHSYALFGWWYPFVITFIYYLIFSIFGALLKGGKFENADKISSISFLLSFYLFLNISLDGFNILMNMLIRGVWQLITLYYIAIYFIKKIVEDKRV